jgi:type II secretory pathway component PulM
MTSVTLTIAEWWRVRNRRERSLLALLALILLALLAWYGIAAPLQRTAAQSEQHRVRAAQLLAEVEAAPSPGGSVPIPAGASVADVLKLSAAEAGFELDTQREEGESVIAISGHAADPASFFGWIAMLRNNHGIIVANVTLAREGDGALKVDALLARGAS